MSGAPAAGDFGWRGGHLAIDLPDARVVFTTRRGGVSEGPFASLNLGRLTADEPGRVAENRRRLEASLGVELVQGRQVHGARVVRAAGAHREPPPSDGQATAAPGLAPTVLTADCVPVALAAPGAVAMLHCGWRGLAAGIVPAGLAALRELGARGVVHAAIGPGAGPCCYEVGPDVRAAFAAHGDTVLRGGRLDLKAVARRELEAGGVAAVHNAGICTICGDPELWYSHRREGGVTGRQAGVAWRS
jgi:polyphenol oxidase